MIQIRLEYAVKARSSESFLEGYEEMLNFCLSTADFSAGTAQALPSGIPSADNILGLAKIEVSGEVTGYVLHRLKSLKTFDYEVDPTRLDLVSAQLKLTWLDPTGSEEPFTVLYPIHRNRNKAVETIPNSLGTHKWEFLLKRAGTPSSGFHYFLRRVVSGEAGDHALTACTQLKAEWDHLRQTDPDNKLGIREAAKKYKRHPCPSVNA
jgi:hypothetical protein